ncbi:winged helix-turn-helix transcriptional regulator [Streptomyces sp. NPDC059010]|uniref:winged helix-turn-helix transcriptional regulator n=1 Tax=Streptomyces sp. NPDC059010 TaxID=3346695 RepID=UPI0036A6B0CE
MTAVAVESGRPHICPTPKSPPTREALKRLASRWTVLITHALEDGPTRFNDLKNRLGVSGQVLARALRDLERDGLVARRVYAEVPVRVEYELTALGGTMCAVVQEIRRWAELTAPAQLADEELLSPILAQLLSGYALLFGRAELTQAA